MLSALFTTSCKEIMSNLDQPVSSYLTVNDADIVVPTGDTYQIEAASINSDKPITYKSSDEKVATVDANGLVTGIADGEATITVAVEASENYNAGEQKIQVAVKRPLTFEALEDGSISISFSGAVLEKPIVYKKNKENKVEITSNTNIPVEKGDKIEFESTNERLTQYDNNLGLKIYANSKCAVYGNVMSMISPDGNYHTNKTITQPYALVGLLYGNSQWNEQAQKYDFYTVAHDKYKLLLPATTLTEGCYYYLLANTGFTEAPELPAKELAPSCYRYMFYFCQDLTEAPALPATTLASYCYANMFRNCQKLTKAPKLPAKEMAFACYYYMFSQCGLTEAPELPATKLATGCYFCMFSNNRSLEKAPALPATELALQCYQGMFQYSGLTEAPKLHAENMEYRCYSDMFAGCTALTKAPALPAKKLASYCYNYMFGGCTALTEAPELKAETLADNCYNSMFYGCSKLNKVVCLATTNATDALGYWLNGAGTDASVTKRTLVRAESNKKWTNNDYWTWGTANWYVPTGWTIEPPITKSLVEVRLRTYTDGPFPFFSMGCEPPVINGAIHLEASGDFKQFYCLPGSENQLTAGDYVFILDLQSDIDTNNIKFVVQNGWGGDAQSIEVSVPVKAGRHQYKLDFPSLTGGNYDCIMKSYSAGATLDLYSVGVYKYE